MTPGKTQWTDDSTLRLHAASVKSGDVPVAFSGLNRIPVLLIGPLLHRYGAASVPLVGWFLGSSGRWSRAQLTSPFSGGGRWFHAAHGERE